MAREVMKAEAHGSAQPIVVAIGAIILLRTIMSAVLPLSFDEAYYWRWSQHLAAGYWDHPPLIAYIIRLGTPLFGDSEFGVRFVPLLLSIAATWAVWRAGAILLEDEYYALLGALLYNLTLMVGVEALVATPDSPAMAAAAFLLYALAKIAETERGEWWLLAGVAGGLSLLSKYTGFFLGVGTLFWLVAAKDQRHWLGTVWPYAGALIALLMFAPVIAWNAANDWISFGRQFGRVEGGALTLRFLGEFVAAQAALATPFVLVLGVTGLTRIYLSRALWRSTLLLLGAILAPAIVYFLWHSLHGRVQGNWPSFLYPMFALSAAAAWRWSKEEWGGRLLRYTRIAALPLALAFNLFAYAQAAWPILPVEGTRDPIARLLASGYRPLAAEIEALRVEYGAGAILTTGYAQTGWLSFYLPSDAPVIQVNERLRWLQEPEPGAELFALPALYVTEEWRDLSDLLRQRFAAVERVATLTRRRGYAEIENYAIYRVSTPTGSILD